jgi:hypothetical protein
MQVWKHCCKQRNLGEAEEEEEDFFLVEEYALRTLDCVLIISADMRPLFWICIDNRNSLLPFVVQGRSSGFSILYES